MIQKPQSLITLKLNGDLLNASDWNDLVSYVDDVKTAAESNAGSGGGNSGGGTITTPDGVISVNSKGNVSISSLKHINLEPAYVANGGSGTYGDVLIKPGDDITLESHHRATEKRDEITVKTSNGQDGTAKAPVKLLIISSDMTLSTKGKKGDDTNVMNVNVTTGEGKGYLKVRAQAIDLRCEEHGGVAIQPKGFDGDGNMNKIKFEHGGGDGLEFGTFNTEKTSIFTDEYRFNKEGVWKMATRLKVASGKEVKNEGTVPIGKSATGAYKYVKQADDFYDIINPDDELCTTKAIIKTANALNGGKNRHAKVTNKGAIEIATEDTYSVVIEETPADVSGVVNIDTIAKTPAEFGTVAEGNIFNSGDFNSTPTDSTIYSNGTQYFSFTTIPAPNIKIESGGELKLGGVLDFGSSFNFGETDNGIEFLYKLTKKNVIKDCGIVKVIGVNNHANNILTVNDTSIGAGLTKVIDSASMLDIIKTGKALNNDYIKSSYIDNNHFGKHGLLILGKHGVRIISNSASEIYEFLNNNPGFGKSDENITVELTINSSNDLTYFEQCFPIGDFLTFEEYNARSLQYPFFTSDLNNTEWWLTFFENHNVKDGQKIIIINSTTDICIMLEVLTSDIIFTTESPEFNNVNATWPENSVSVTDLIKLVNWMKTNHEGPWTPST